MYSKCTRQYFVASMNKYTKSIGKNILKHINQHTNSTKNSTGFM